MPRLYHRKSQLGCMECKRRKVKCNEAKPACGACIRHKVDCQYPEAAASTPGPYPSPTSSRARAATRRRPVRAPHHNNVTEPTLNVAPSPSHSISVSLPDQTNWSAAQSDPQLELRLLHHFTAFASLSFSPSTSLWQVHAPRLAFRFRFVFDAIMAWSSLHLSRTDDQGAEAFPGVSASTLQHISHQFFNSALSGYRNAVTMLYADSAASSTHTDLFEAVYVSSSLVSLCTLCQLGSSGPAAPPSEPEGEALWAQLVMGTRQIVGQWKSVHGRESWLTSEVYTSQSNLNSTVNFAELFDPHNRVLLDPILEWAAQYTTLGVDEREAYQHTLSYIGLIYTKIRSGAETPQASCLRLQALPARVPRRFGVAVVEQQPLALSVITFAFALMKLLEDDVPWLRGIAEGRIRIIQQKLPRGWWSIIQWPVKIASGEIEKSADLTVHFVGRDGVGGGLGLLNTGPLG